MPLYDYKCKEGHTTTHLVMLPKLPPKELRCECGKRAYRVIAVPAKHRWANGKKP